VAQGLAVASVYAFASVDYPGAAQSLVFDSDGTTAVGSTTAFGISDTGEIAGYYTDAAGRTHGFIYAAGAFSTVDVAGARDTQLTRIKNGGPVTGFCTDALNEQHGLTGQ
jgi:probable HAF family extracellular repeat protein